MSKKSQGKKDPTLPLDILIQNTLEDLYRRRAELRTVISTLENRLAAQSGGSSEEANTKTAAS